MNTRIIAAALAFFTTFGFSSLLMRFAYNQPEQQTSRWIYRKPVNKQVLRFLERDIRNGQQRLAGLSQPEGFYTPFVSRFDLIEYSNAVSDYVNKSNSMDDSELPQDLRAAWREHMRAWMGYRNLLKEFQSYSARDFEDYGVERMHEDRTDEIDRTWFKVLRIAGDNYGAYPANAY